MRTRSNSEVFQRIWELYAAGRGPEILEHLDPEVEWRPAVVDPGPYHGHDGVRAWASASQRAWKSVTVVLESLREVDGCVIASGRISALDHAGDQVVDRAIACVAEFRDGRVVRAATFLSGDEALAWVSARPALP
ncbi:MAG TPA: nuclear transport factor 2 family protein [Solirubrobacteraceae bacterium]